MADYNRDDKWREWRLDELGEPRNNERLNASKLRHGLMPRLSGDSGQYLTGLGVWTTLVPVTDIVCFEGDVVTYDGSVVYA